MGNEMRARQSVQLDSAAPQEVMCLSDPKLKHGSVMWRVESGKGQFAEATGLITSNFTIGEGGEVIDHHCGVIFVK